MGYERNFECWYRNVCTYENGCDGCSRFLEMSNLMQSSGIPKAKQVPIDLIPSKADYDAFCTLADIKEDILEFVNNGENLYLCSKHTGNGKTSWAIKLMLKYFDSVWAGNGLRVRGLFVHVPTLLFKLKDFDNPIDIEYKNNLSSVDLVIWDDIAHSDISKYDYNNLLIYLESRLFAKKANIYTSNICSGTELEKCLGAKLKSRILETSEVIEFKGKDRRGGK